MGIFGGASSKHETDVGESHILISKNTYNVKHHFTLFYLFLIVFKQKKQQIKTMKVKTGVLLWIYVIRQAKIQTKQKTT